MVGFRGMRYTFVSTHRLAGIVSNPGEIHMFRHTRLATAIAVLVVAVPLTAQGNENQGLSPTGSAAVAAPALAPLVAPVVDPVFATGVAAQPVSLAPTFSNATVGVRANVVAPATPLAPTPQGSQGRNPAMMIVGGVALLVGAVVGGDSGTLIMIAGGALGLYGLWQYLK